MLAISDLAVVELWVAAPDVHVGLRVVVDVALFEHTQAFARYKHPNHRLAGSGLAAVELGLLPSTATLVPALLWMLHWVDTPSRPSS